MIVSHHYVTNKLYLYVCLVKNLSIQQNHCCLSLNMNRICISKYRKTKKNNSVRWITRLVIR